MNELTCKAASAFPDEAAANRNIFFDRAGRARSIGEVYGVLTNGFDSKPVLQVAAAAPGEAAGAWMSALPKLPTDIHVNVDVDPYNFL